MQVSCPGCHSRFLLPDGVKDGTRLRCSVCKTEFSFQAQPAAPKEPDAVQPSAAVSPAPQETPDTGDRPAQAGAPGKEEPLSFAGTPKGNELPELAAPKKRSGGCILWLLLLVLIGVGGFVAWQTLPEFREQVLQLKDRILSGKIAGDRPVASAPVAGVEKGDSELILRDVRQYYISNEKAGHILVVDGVVVNQGPNTYRNIQVDAALIGKDRRTIDSRVQKAGVRLTSTQLKVMSEAEMVEALTNEKEIALSNSNVRTGAEVPFTFVFFSPSKDVGEYAVKVGAFELEETGEATPPVPPAGAPQPEPAQGRPEPAAAPAPAPAR